VDVAHENIGLVATNSESALWRHFRSNPAQFHVAWRPRRSNCDASHRHNSAAGGMGKVVTTKNGPESGAVTMAPAKKPSILPGTFNNEVSSEYCVAVWARLTSEERNVTVGGPSRPSVKFSAEITSVSASALPWCTVRNKYSRLLAPHT